MEFIQALISSPAIVIGVLLFVVGWYFGTRNERKHLESLECDERLVGHVIISSERLFVPNTQADGELVVGSVVIAQDRFKKVMADILSLFGKNLTVYESLLERARREAVLRMKMQAHESGFNQVYGVRLEMCNLGAHDPNSTALEIIAYGTAVKSSRFV